VSKLILVSIVIVSIAVPIRLCAGPTPKRALRRTQWILAAFVFFWAFLCIVWYPILQPLE
jgi:hypothetical protein